MPPFSPGSDPPPYPPKFTFAQVKAWVIAGLTDKPPAAEYAAVTPADLKIRRMVDAYVRDQRHREQLKAWARGQADEGAFREVCRLRDWNRTTALRNVELALGMIYMMMNITDFGRF